MCGQNVEFMNAKLLVQRVPNGLQNVLNHLNNIINLNYI
jgi:hypothetical protein